MDFTRDGGGGGGGVHAAHGEQPALFRKRSTLPPNTSFALAHTLLHSAAEAAEAQATQRAAQAQQRAAARAIRENCPALEKAMRTLAKPFDPKAAPATRSKQVAPAENPDSTPAGQDFSLAPLPLNAKRSSMPSGGLRGLLEQKERELARNNAVGGSSSNGAKHVTLVEPPAQGSSTASNRKPRSREQSSSRGSSREGSVTRGSVASSSPPSASCGPSAQSAGLHEFKHSLRALLATAQHERDRDVDALGQATGRGGQNEHSETKHARMELQDLIQMEQELDEEFGPLHAPHGPSHVLGEQGNRSYTRSTPASAQHSRRGSFSDAPGTSPPQPVGIGAGTFGAKVREVSGARRGLDQLGLARQRSVESGASVRGMGAQASLTGGLSSVDHLPAHLPRPNNGGATARSGSRPQSSMAGTAQQSLSRRSSLSQPGSSAPSPTPFLRAASTTAATSGSKHEEKQESSDPASAMQQQHHPRSRSPLPLSRSPPSASAADALLQAAAAAEQQQAHAADAAARGLKDAFGGRFVFARPSTAKPAPTGVAPLPSHPSLSGAPTARDPSPSTHRTNAAQPSTTARPSTAATASRLYSSTTASSAAKKQPPVAPPSGTMEHPLRDKPLARPQTAIRTSRGPSPLLNSAPLSPLTSSPLLRSRKLSDEEASDEESERDLIIQAVELEAAERRARMRRRKSSLPEEFERLEMMRDGTAVSAVFNESLPPPHTALSPSSSASVAPAPLAPQVLRASSNSVTSSRTASPARPLTAGLRKSISSTEAEGLTAVLKPTPPATLTMHPMPPQTLSNSNSLASVGSIESLGSKSGKILLAPLTASASSLPSSTNGRDSSSGSDGDDDADEVRSNDGRDNNVVPAARERERARSKDRAPATIKSPTSRRSKSQKALSRAAAASSSLRPRSSHHVVPEKAATPGSSNVSVASSACSTSTLTTASARLRSSVLASLHSGKYSKLVTDLATTDLASAEERLAQLGKEYNKLRHIGDTKASEVVTKTKDLTQLVDRSTVDSAELKQLNGSLIEKESEWTDLLSQQNQVASENETLAVEIRATEAKRARDEKRFEGFKELSQQLDTKISAAQRKLAEVREETALLAADIPQLQQQVDEKALAYEQQLDQQRMHVQTLELLRRRRERGSPIDEEDDASTSASTGAVSPGSKQDHLLRLWAERMEHITSATGVSDFIDLLRRIEDHPSAKATAEAHRAQLQARLDQLRLEQVALAKLLGLKRMSSRAPQASPAAAPAESSDRARGVDCELPSLVTGAMAKLEAIQARLQTSSAPSASGVRAGAHALNDGTPDAARCLLQQVEASVARAADKTTPSYHAR